jgi:hypothetical protein
MTIESLRELLARILDRKNKLREDLYNSAKNHIGWDLSVQAPNELGCAESVSKIVQMVSPNFPTFLSTTQLYAWLIGRWTQVSNPARGDIIISPTGYSPTGKNGHVGIIGENCIYSNNSFTGRWSNAYTLEKWRKYYSTFPVLFFRIK